MVGVNLREDARHGIHEIHLQNPAKASVFIRLQLVNLVALIFLAFLLFSLWGCSQRADSGVENQGWGKENSQDTLWENHLSQDGGVKAGNGNGQMLNLQLDAEISTLDPQAAVDSASFEVIGCMMEGLYTVDEKEKPVPALAEHTEVSGDGKRFTFSLREACWSDGSPVTAEDFVYGWQRGIDLASGNENRFLFETAGIRNAGEICAGRMDPKELGIRAVDEKTLEVELEQPVPYFLSMLALPMFYPMNQAFFEGCGGQYGTSPETVLSNGPFCLKQYQPAGQEIFLEKNPGYWREEQVKLSGVSYQVVKESQQAFMAYELGDLDMAFLSGEQAEWHREREDFRTLPLGSLWYISPNLQVPGLENKWLRKALAIAFDKEKAALLVMRDGSKPAYGAVPSSTMYGPEGQDFREEGKAYLPGDQALAREYFERARKELGREEFTFTLLVEDTEGARNLGQFLQEEIGSALPGVTIELEPVPKKMRLERMAEGEYELGLARWGADYPDPLAFLGMWEGQSPFNYGGWSNRAYDRMIEDARREPLMGDPKRRWQVLHQAEELVMEEAAIFPVCEKASAVLLKNTVKGAQFHAVGVNRVWAFAWKEE